MVFYESTRLILENRTVKFEKKPLMDGNKPINNIIEYLIAQYFNMFMWKIWNYSKLPPF